jgi:hypothetical protein
MLFAGFKSIIATMWSVVYVFHQTWIWLTSSTARSMVDVDGPMVAKSVYKYIFDSDGDYINADDVAYALDAAVQQLRGLHSDPSRWALYIHMGI